MDKIRVVLVENQTIVRKGIRALLNSEADIEVIGEAGDGREAVEKVKQLMPDVVVMDIAMPILNGLEATRQIKKKFSEIKVLILSMHTDDEYIFEILKAGGSGYVVKQAAPAELISAIHDVYRGEFFLSPSISKMVIKEYIHQAKTRVEKDNYNKLTNCEREVLQLIVEGHPNREIAKLQYVSIKTVETHRTHLMDKLDIHSTVELTKYAIRKKVISLDP